MMRFTGLDQEDVSYSELVALPLNLQPPFPLKTDEYLVVVLVDMPLLSSMRNLSGLIEVKPACEDRSYGESSIEEVELSFPKL
jgi:hypothetical protein